MIAPGPKACAPSLVIKVEAPPLPFPGTTVNEFPSIKTLSLSPMLRADWATAKDTGAEISTTAPVPISRVLSLVITPSLRVVFQTGSKRMSHKETRRVPQPGASKPRDGAYGCRHRTEAFGIELVPQEICPAPLHPGPAKGQRR